MFIFRPAKNEDKLRRNEKDGSKYEPPETTTASILAVDKAVQHGGVIVRVLNDTSKVDHNDIDVKKVNGTERKLNGTQT